MSETEREEALRVELARAMEELRAEYRPELVRHLAEVRLAVGSVQASTLAPVDIERARLSAHKLRGTAGSHGFHAISAAAGAIEDALVARSKRRASADATLGALAVALEALREAADDLDEA